MENSLNGTIKLQLNKLNNVEVVEYKGKRCVCIPADENGIFISEKGGLYIDFFLGKMFEEKWGYTHSLKRRLTMDEYKRSTPEQRKKMPDVGYFQPTKPRDNGGNYAPQQTQQQTQQAASSPTTQKGSVDDLPF